MESSRPTSLLWIRWTFDLRSHHHGKESSWGSGEGLGWPSPHLHSRPQQEELKAG